MAEPAGELMTVDEFLSWDDGTDTRYELVDGRIVAIAPPGAEHRTIVVNASAVIGARLRKRPPCRGETEAGIGISDHVRWQADIAVTCGPLSYDVVDPLLIVEVLSPSTRANDVARKLVDYKDLPSVAEVWLVDSERRWAQVWSREGDGWHGRDHVGGATFPSRVLDAQVSLDELYLNTGL
jgi:Uma2 family endonuclease